MQFNFDQHLLILLVIIVSVGAFGGILNYLHSFDTLEKDKRNRYVKINYTFLGIGSALVVPAFLKMIASDLIKNTDKYDNINYLIFAGFCFVAAIFSRRFINTIGEKILETAKQAEKTANESKQQVEKTKLELTSTQERIEDVKVAVNLSNTNIGQTVIQEKGTTDLLYQLVNSYIERTTIEDYSERLKIKAELGRNMGQIIVRNNLQKNELLDSHPKEGMYLAVAYSVELSPDANGVEILNKISKIASQLYTKYVILLGYRTLANSGFIKKSQIPDIYFNVNSFKTKADRPLLRNIDDTISVLKLIEPGLT
jgi:hypothetical protein